MSWAGFGAALIGLVADQGTKTYAEAVHLLTPPVPSMAYHRASSELVAGFGSVPPGAAELAADSFLSVEITHVANAGVMLGALEQAPHPIPIAAFLLATALALGLAAWLFHIGRAASPWLRIGAVTLAAGVLGNLIDRLRLGYVVDWLYLQWKLGTWAVDAPAFNFADLLIIAGACIAGGALAQRHGPTIHARIRARGKPA